jgi:hypothetical protein
MQAMIRLSLTALFRLLEQAAVGVAATYRRFAWPVTLVGRQTARLAQDH